MLQISGIGAGNMFDYLQKSYDRVEVLYEWVFLCCKII